MPLGSWGRVPSKLVIGVTGRRSSGSASEARRLICTGIRTQLLKCFVSCASQTEQNNVRLQAESKNTALSFCQLQDAQSFHSAPCIKKLLCMQSFQQHFNATVLMLPSVKHHPNPQLRASQTNNFRGRRPPASSHARAGAHQPATEL